MKELLFFILGMVVGGLVMMIMMSCLLAGRMSEYESESRQRSEDRDSRDNNEEMTGVNRSDND